ncbi:MAG: alpha/beta hydrolase [Calditrichia bacterium]
MTNIGKNYETPHRTFYGIRWQQPVRAALAAGKFAATLIIVHGLAEYSSRYEHVAAALAESKHRHCRSIYGHGQSAGKRAFVNRFDDYLRDLAIFVDRVCCKKTVPINHCFYWVTAWAVPSRCCMRWIIRINFPD